MGKDLLNHYVDNMAYSRHYARIDKSQVKGYEMLARKDLEKWKDKVANGAFMLYTSKQKSGERMVNFRALQEKLIAMDYEKYPCGLEHFSLADSMFKKGRTAAGAECGIKQELKYEFRSSNVNTRLDKMLDGAWKVEDYWTDPAKQNLSIVRIKKRVEELIAKGFGSDESEINILSIFEELEEPPFGFMPNNVSAFVLGFVLKEYASNGYFLTNHKNTEEMTPTRMKDAIKRAIDEAATHSDEYRNEYIRKMSETQRNFLKFTSSVFDLSGVECDSVENVGRVLREKISKWSFPLWCVKFVLDAEPQLTSSKEDILFLIDLYCDLLNTSNSKNRLQEIEVANKIGEKVSSAISLQDDLSKLLTSENCRKGMIAYARQYREGKLVILSGKIGDGGAYIDAIKRRFTTDSKWLWNQDTVDSMIDDVILDYEIISESNKSLLPKCDSLSSVVSSWCRRLDNVHMPYSVIYKNVANGSLKALLEQFRNVKINGKIMDKKAFYKELSSHRVEFDDFYYNQLAVFKKACDFLLTGMDDDEVLQLMSNLKAGQFTKRDTDYFKYLENTIKEFKNESKKAQLKKLWSDKTGTKDPVDWSERYTTPLLCMFEDEELKYAKHMLTILLSPNSVDKEMEEALKYFNDVFPWERLNDSDARDSCFMERLVGDYAVMLPNVDEVRTVLRENVRFQVYDWTEEKSVKDCLKNMATKAYKIDGLEKVRAVINNMDSSQLREYLNELISNNLTVGIEILKNK